ncbi:MAG: hypothetical protein KGJ62_09700 [Armatimonadetes bacterium]|nr:hypothetical protein [Armatimonadota bacterium]MDE2205780.1 hypothetical protein [Armatimonadota bacterium]
MKLISLARTLLCTLLFAGLAHSICAAQPPPGELLQNPGFEGGSGSDGQGAGIPAWTAFGLGYDIDRATYRSGEQSLRCDSVNATSIHGGYSNIVLNQDRAIPVVVSGWSKADSVSGPANGDYAVYVDATYMDGTPLFGQIAEFDAGSHDWQRRQELILPAKPLKSLMVYALFRLHSGTVWFDDFSVHEVSGDGIYDSQPLMPLPHEGDTGHALQVASAGLALDFSSRGVIDGTELNGVDVTPKSTGGIYVRDVGSDGPLNAMTGTTAPYGKGGMSIDIPHNSDLGISLNVKFEPVAGGIGVSGEIDDLTHSDRAVTVYVAIPIRADGWLWGDDIRHSNVVHGGDEYTNQVRVPEGATGGMSLYPFGCVAHQGQGLAIANQMDWPTVYRIFYNGSSRQLVIAWDFALTSKSVSWQPRNARFGCTVYALPASTASWGFRAAALAFYAINAPDYTRRATKDGTWLPFTDPSTIQQPQDFNFAYHEGDNSLKADNNLGILAFRYTEPMSWWMAMPPSTPRTMTNAVAEMKSIAADPKQKDHAMAQAVLSSGTQDADGQYNLQFQNQPWSNGAVWVLDPNPEIAATSAAPTRGSLAYSLAQGDAMYGSAAAAARGVQAGEYLDSLEGWSDIEDYRLSDLQAATSPLTFDATSRSPVLPEWFSTFEFARFLSSDLHNRGKLLFANYTPIRFSIFSSILDVMGIEVNWLGGPTGFNPDSDATMDLRRTLSFQRPYLLLMNTDFNAFSAADVDLYFQRSMFYGIFPSMFSANAATNPYWQNPTWYNRDRPTFKRYLPVIDQLSSAGWQPVTWAASANRNVYIERFGSRYFTLLNNSDSGQTSTISIDMAGLGDTGMTPTVTDMLSGASLPTTASNGSVIVKIHLDAQHAGALRLSK